MKTGIMTFHFANNYGAALQCYALLNTIENNCNSEVRVVDYRSSFIRFTDAVRILPITTNTKEIASGLKTLGLRLARLRKFNDFHHSFFHLSQRYNSARALKKNPPAYDCFICGSDQIWNPVITLGVADPYYLGFARPGCRRISYAPSFGITHIKPQFREKIKNYLEKMDGLSVREQEGLSIVKDICGRDAEQLIDPTFLPTRENWEQLAVKPTQRPPYILLYIMQKDDRVYDYVAKIKNELKLPVVEISRYGYQPSCVDETLVDVGPQDFLGLFLNADFVITNSFHGLAYSVIFEKNFYLIPSKKFNSRMDSLLQLLHIKGDCPLEAGELLKDRYNWKSVESAIEKEREKSIRYLQNHLQGHSYEDKASAKHISLSKQEDCCGCSACAQICPQNCISMVQDSEGFLYPNIDSSRCVECGLCKTACPMLREMCSDETVFKTPKALGGWHRDDAVRADSSSGGAFTLFADFILEHGGVVYGCTLNDELRAVHVAVEKKEELKTLRRSKYVQSEIGHAYEEIKRHLLAERLVFFTGTPCQAAGLKTYLSAVPQEKLYICDFVCHGTPSPKVFEAYLAYLEKELGSAVQSFTFRNKEHGWSSTGQQQGTLIRLKDNSLRVHCPAFRDAFMNGFLDDVYLRPACYACKFKSIPKDYSDITIGDFWGVNAVDKSLNDGKGTSLVLLNSRKGKEIFEKVKDRFYYKECDFSKAIARNKSLIRSVEYNKRRAEFFEDFEALPFEKIRKKYLTGFIWARHKVVKILKGMIRARMGRNKS